mmetsp:Transcript_17670/g.31419  ORF Transcript_17670/g.31419 Transcript_17670/m.31419 type:complete len:272 (+) Transcript_17670:33-848(+)
MHSPCCQKCHCVPPQFASSGAGHCLTAVRHCITSDSQRRLLIVRSLGSGVVGAGEPECSPAPRLSAMALYSGVSFTLDTTALRFEIRRCHSSSLAGGISPPASRVSSDSSSLRRRFWRLLPVARSAVCVGGGLLLPLIRWRTGPDAAGAATAAGSRVASSSSASCVSSSITCSVGMAIGVNMGMNSGAPALNGLLTGKLSTVSCCAPSGPAGTACTDSGTTASAAGTRSTGCPSSAVACCKRPLTPPSSRSKLGSGVSIYELLCSGGPGRS